MGFVASLTGFVKRRLLVNSVDQYSAINDLPEELQPFARKVESAITMEVLRAFVNFMSLHMLAVFDSRPFGNPRVALHQVI